MASAKSRLEAERAAAGDAAASNAEGATAGAAATLGGAGAVPGGAGAAVGAGSGDRAVEDVARAFSSEARALATSPTLQRTIGLLDRLRKSQDGEVALEKLALRACVALESGSNDWDSVVGDGAAWAAAGIAAGEARAALQGAAALLTPPRRGDLRAAARGATAERAAALKVIAFDQKPDECKGYMALFDLEDKSRFDAMNPNAATDLDLTDPRVEGIRRDPEIREAAKFAKRLEVLPSEAECVRARLRRLLEMPLVQEASAVLAAQAAAGESPALALVEALAPLRERLYNATRLAQLRQRPPEEVQDEKVKVVTLEFDALQAAAGLLVFIAIAFGASQAFKAALEPSSDPIGGQLPTYGFQQRPGQLPYI